MQKHKISILLAIVVAVLQGENLAAATTVPNSNSVAGSFINLDFESGSTTAGLEPFGFLDWAVAAPGWSHSDGADTQIVYNGDTHVGITQWFRLNDGLDNLFDGNYSFSFKSGAKTTFGDQSWVNAYISQIGLIPAGTTALQLRSTGPLGVWLGDVQVPMIALSNNAYTGDISMYAGLTKELRLVNLTDPSTYYPQSIATVDSIQFLPVPLSPSAVFLLIGLLGLPILRRK